MGTESKLPTIGMAPAEVAVVQVREDLTTVLRVKVIAQAAIVQDCWTCEPLIGPSAGPKPGPTVKRIRERLGRPMDLTIVFNSQAVLSLVQKAPVSTEGSIRSHLQHAVLQHHKTDLSKCYWTLTPLSYRFDDQRGLTEALSNKLNVLICAAPKPTVQTLHLAFEKEGFTVVQTLFPVPALTKAFDQFAGETFGTQMIALLHVRDKTYSLAVYRSGGLLSYAENKAELTAADIATEVKNHITAFQGKYKTALRCVFVSSDTGEDQEIVDALKAADTYARAWNACRKLSFASDANAELTSNKGSHYNVLAGGVSAAAQAVSNAVAHDENDDPDPLGNASDAIIMARPFAVAACLLLVPLAFLIHQNGTLEHQVKAADARYKSEQKKVEQKRTAAGDLKQKVTELELFSNSRRKWPQLLNELRSISVAGVVLQQVRASDTLTAVDPNPFQAAPGQVTRKSQGSLVLEARNEAGLGALERFMESVKNATQIRTLLNKKRPPRLLNNLVLGAGSEEEPEKTLFTVEYSLDEKSF